jgi:hypothetical protein
LSKAIWSKAKWSSLARRNLVPAELIRIKRRLLDSVAHHEVEQAAADEAAGKSSLIV